MPKGDRRDLIFLGGSKGDLTVRLKQAQQEHEKWLNTRK
jgi:hypothetical protein